MKLPTRERLSAMAFQLAKAYERELFPNANIPDDLIDARVFKYGIHSVFVAEWARQSNA